MENTCLYVFELLLKVNVGTICTSAVTPVHVLIYNGFDFGPKSDASCGVSLYTSLKIV